MRFTVRRPPTGEVSPCCHRPSDGDVTCSVEVGVAPPGSAGLALEDRLALAVFGCDVPARGATLRRIRGRYLLDPAQSLVLQPCDEPAPATSADSAVEPTLLGNSGAGLLGGSARRAGHRADIEGLDSDQIEAPRDVSGGFLDPVLAPIPVAGFQLRDRPFRFRAAVGTTLASSQPLLQHLQPLRLHSGQAGCVQQFACRQRSRHGHAAVDTHHAAITRPADGVGDVRERDMPAACSITGNPVGLHTGWHWARQAKPHPTDLGHPDPTKSAVQPLDMMRSQTDLSKGSCTTGSPVPNSPSSVAPGTCRSSPIPSGSRAC